MLRLRVPVRWGTWEIACERPKHSLVSNTFCLPRIILNVTIFQKPQLQSVLLFFKFVHQCHLLYLICCLYLLFMFWAVIFVLLNFVAVLTVWILRKFRDNLLLWFSVLERSAWYKKEAFCATKVNLVTYFQFWGKWVKC